MFFLKGNDGNDIVQSIVRIGIDPTLTSGGTDDVADVTEGVVNEDEADITRVL